MPKITAVEPQKKNTHRFNIFLEGQFVFGADEDLVVERRLITGKILDQLQIEKLLFEAEVGKLMERMYRLFNIRQRSEKEVRNYLKTLSFKRKAKGQDEISDKSIELCIDKLKQKGLLSDETFAKSWVEARGKKKGKTAIKFELLQKGISREIVDQVLEILVEDEKVLERLLERKLEPWKSLSVSEFRKKAYDFLLRRGFNYSLIKNVVENLIKKK